MNLPVPFHAGDIVTIDCRPVAPVSHVVILRGWPYTNKGLSNQQLRKMLKRLKHI